MSPKTLDILCSPQEHAPLEIVSESVNGDAAQYLFNGEHGLKFPIREGIPVFVEPHQITGINTRFRGIYDRWAPFYDLLSRLGLYILGISEVELRKAFIGSLEIKAGDRVLSTSVGTGSESSTLLIRDCPGGNCSIDCIDGDTCTIETCEGGSCTILCGQGSTCTCAPTGCSVEPRAAG